MGEPARTSAAGGVIQWMGDKLGNYFTKAADPEKAMQSRNDFCAKTDAKLQANEGVGNIERQKYESQCEGPKARAPGPGST